jgi:MYXO-CTERM domain-containing protein
MTNIDLTAGNRASRLTHVVRALWPVPTLIAAALIAQQLLVTSRYDVGGHAAEHLTGASAPFMAAAILCILFWTTPLARHQADLLVIGGVWFATTLLVMVGNLRVVDDLVAAGYSHTPTGSVPDVADHSLANSSVWYAAVAALVLVAAWRRRRHIGNRATIGAVAATVIIPPWIIPGAGVIVLAIVRVVQCSRAAAIGLDRDDARLG